MAHAQDAVPGVGTSASEPAAALDVARQQLTEIEGELAGSRVRTEVPAGEAGSAPTPDLQLLERLEALQRQLVAALEREAEGFGGLSDAGNGVGSPGLAGEYSFLEYDSARNALRDEELSAERREASLRAARDSLIRAREDLEARERVRRLAKETLDSTSDATRTPELAEALRLAELESRVARVSVQLREVEARLETEALTSQSSRVEELKNRLPQIRARTRLTEEDRAATRLELARREERVRQDTASAQRGLDFISERYFEAKQRLDRVGGADPVLIEEVESLRMGQRYRRRQLEFAADRLERLAKVRALWDRRYAILTNQATSDDIVKWRSEEEREVADLSVEERLLSAQLAEARREFLALQSQIESTPAGEAQAWMRARAGHLDSLLRVFEEELASVQDTRTLHAKLMEDLGSRKQGVDLRRLWRESWRRTGMVWRYEIASVDDRPITIGKIVTGVLLLIVGLFASKKLSRVLGRRLLPRLRLAEGAAYAIQSVIFYVLVVTFTLFALRVVNVPLTAFTILGGALAIGFGFGSQNVVSNFISGLILLAERPIRAGDLIQLGELYGLVEHIGLRSTRVRTGNNIDIIVPNTSFLEQNVINWTLSDTKVRVMVGVGIVYGSPTREFREILRKSVVEHGRVLKSPEPIVLFANFGESSLDFEIHFWIHMRHLMDRRIVESDVRFRIDGLCREAGIIIAFPQRDVHLDCSRPLEIRLVETEEA